MPHDFPGGNNPGFAPSYPSLGEQIEGGDQMGSDIRGYRLQCPVVWFYKAFIGDTVTKKWMLDDYYVANFISIAVNGVMQTTTTHFTQTSPSKGLFEMVNVPKTNDRVGVWWARYCDEDMALGLPIDPGTGNPQLPWAPPGLGNGKRVLVAGRDNGNNIVLGKTEDVYAASPAYTAIPTTGLPATTTGEVLVRVDPFDPSNVAVLTSVSEDEFGLYKNPTWRSGGTWTQILSMATAEAAASITGSTGWVIGQVRYTIARPDFIAVYGRLTGGSATFLGIFHSHDGGTTWEVSNDLSGNGPEVPHDFQIGQHNWEIMHVWIPRPGGAVRHAHGLSTDHGHSVPDTLVHGVNSVQDLYLPYAGNDDDLDCYEYGTSHFLFTDDGWATTSAPAVNPVKATLQIDNTDSSKAVWGDDDDLDGTVDAFATFTNLTVTRGPEHREHIGQVLGGWIFAAGAAGGGNSALQMFRTPGWTTVAPTECTGDLGGILSSGQIECIIPDWTT